MKNEKIIRNRLKIKSAIINAQQFINIQKEYGSFDSFIWSIISLLKIILILKVTYLQEQPFRIKSARI